MTKELYYVCINGGDGSAYPSFVESKELSEWIEENEDEGFTEAAGSITLRSDSPIDVEGIETKESYFLENMTSEWPNFEEDKIQDYIDTFFSGVRPIFAVRDSDKEGFTSTYGEKETYFYVDIYHGDKLVDTKLYEEGTSREKILKEINGE